MSCAKRRGDNTRQGDAEEDAQPDAKRPRMGDDAGADQSSAASVREPSAEVLIDAVVEIAEQNSWRRLAGEFRLVALSAEVLRAILGLAEDDAAELALSLKDLRIKTVATLLDACENITVEDGSFKAVGKLRTVAEFTLEDLASLRDKVKQSQQRALAAASASLQPALSAVRSPSNSPPQAGSSPVEYLTDARQVADECLKKMTALKWPSLDTVILKPMELEASHVHAQTANGVKGFVSIPKPNQGNTPGLYSALLDGIFDDNPKLTRGPQISDRLGWQRKNLALFGPSGCGKTRKAFELICVQGGYYFSFRTLICDKNFGSFALSNVLSAKSLGLKNSECFPALSSAAVSESPAIFEARRQLVHFAVQCVFAAYDYVKHCWQESFKSSKPGETVDIPHWKWLLVQLFPIEFFGVDIFDELANALFKKLDPRSRTLTALRGEQPDACIIDEAQVFDTSMKNMFFSQKSPLPKNPYRSLLSAVISGAIAARGDKPIILAGTGLSLVSSWDTIVSSMAVADSDFLFLDFTVLDNGDVDTQLRRLLSFDDQERLQEACQWLVGRPRFVTSFIERAIMDNKTISALLPEYVEFLTCGSDQLRTVYGSILRLAESKTAFPIEGKQTLNPLGSFLMDSYWLSLGFPERVSKTSALVELGIGYAPPRTMKPAMSAVVKAESLVLEAARQYRSTFEAEGDQTQEDRLPFHFVKNALSDLQDMHSAMGKRFEYFAAERLLSCLCSETVPLQEHPLLQHLSPILPSELCGFWEMPGWQFGRWSLCGPAAFPEEVLRGFDPSSSARRVWFPDDLAGPDVWALLRSKDRKRLMLVLVQIKLRSATFDASEALLSVDPSKLYHVNRGAKSGPGPGCEHVRPEKKDSVESLMTKLFDLSVPVVRILLSGASSLKIQSGMEPHNRKVKGISASDLRIIVDPSNLGQVFEPALVEAIQKLKS